MQCRLLLYQGIVTAAQTWVLTARSSHRCSVISQWEWDEPVHCLTQRLAMLLLLAAVSSRPTDRLLCLFLVLCFLCISRLVAFIICLIYFCRWTGYFMTCFTEAVFISRCLMQCCSVAVSLSAQLVCWRWENTLVSGIFAFIDVLIRMCAQKAYYPSHSRQWPEKVGKDNIFVTVGANFNKIMSHMYLGITARRNSD